MWMDEQGIAWEDSTDVHFESFDHLPESYSSGCGGPSYGWNADGTIFIGSAIPRSPLKSGVLQWKELIYKNALKHQLPPHLIAGIMSLESGGKPDAGSPAGAMGLMQLIRSTANQMAGRTLSDEEIFDPEINVDLGSKLLAQLWSKYQGDPIKIAFSYNAGSPRCGSGCVRDYQDKPKMPCIADCQPNQFGLKADCYAGNKVTVDYGGIVAGFANDALLSGEFPLKTDGALGESEEPSSLVGPLLVGLGIVGLGVAVFRHRDKFKMLV